MRMQLQSLLLSEASQRRDAGKLSPRYEVIRQELLNWRTSWQTEFLPTISTEDHAWNNAVQYLDRWSNLHYHATTLMLHRHSSDKAEFLFDTTRQIVLCCGLLVRQHQFSFSVAYDDVWGCQIPIFPVDWTVCHLLFASGIQLLSPGTRDAADRVDWDRTVRSCLATMALMEADPANVSTGFSEILEKLYDQEISTANSAGSSVVT